MLREASSPTVEACGSVDADATAMYLPVPVPEPRVRKRAESNTRRPDHRLSTRRSLTARWLPGFTTDTDPGRAVKANLPPLCGCCPLRAAARKMKGFPGGHSHGRDPPDRVDVLRPPCCYSRRIDHLAAASSQLSFRHPGSIAGSGLESLRVSFPRAQEGLSRTAPPPLLHFLPYTS